MNYLAHSYLSYTDGQLVGQFLEDFIRNRDRFSYPPNIVEGILLHREIDTFTDAHPVVSAAKKIFRPLVRLYAGAFLDVAFDYFLANSLPENVLQEHAKRVYRVLGEHQEFLPEQLGRMLERMEADNWLYNYRYDWGIKFSIQNVLNKSRYLEKDLPVMDAFLKNKNELEVYFNRFFPELEAYCRQRAAQF